MCDLELFSKIRSQILATLETVFQKIFNISKSPGPDDWPPVLRETADSISVFHFVYYLATKSLNVDLLLTGWKKGCITPIYVRALPFNSELLTYYINI